MTALDNKNLQLVYTLLCDDVRIEMGNKISLMGIFQNIMVEKLPVSLIKFAVINHWRGKETIKPKYEFFRRTGQILSLRRSPLTSNWRLAVSRIMSAFSSMSFSPVPALTGSRRSQTLLWLMNFR